MAEVREGTAAPARARAVAGPLAPPTPTVQQLKERRESRRAARRVAGGAARVAGGGAAYRARVLLAILARGVHRAKGVCRGAGEVHLVGGQRGRVRKNRRVQENSRSNDYFSKR